MFPHLFRFPPLGFEISPSLAFIWLALLAGLGLGPRVVEAAVGIPRRQFLKCELLLAVLALAGGRLHYVLTHPAMFAADPWRAFNVWGGAPFHTPGAILAIALFSVPVARAFRASAGGVADGIALSTSLALIVGRVGCFVQGCCFGEVCHLPWCLAFPRDSTTFLAHRDAHLVAGSGAWSLPTHPLQLYFALAAAGALLVGLWLAPRRRYDGQVALVMLLVYAASNAALESFRSGLAPHPKWGPLAQLQWMLLAMTAASFAVLALAELRHRRRAGLVASPAAAASLSSER